jgi:ribulose-5-phosphate 4-epimerase/fuculose-1-phosphate aldolase
VLDAAGVHVRGDPPTKEALLHLAMYRERPRDRAVVHLHSTHSVAVSVLADVDAANVLPPLTAYYAMRIGTLPLVPYFAPGDAALADAVAGLASRHHAMLLSNHGPVVSGAALDAAADAIEELEATARLWLLVRHDNLRPLDAAALADIARRFPRHGAA